MAPSGGGDLWIWATQIGGIKEDDGVQKTAASCDGIAVGAAGWAPLGPIVPIVIDIERAPAPPLEGRVGALHDD